MIIAWLKPNGGGLICRLAHRFQQMDFELVFQKRVCRALVY